MRQGDFFFSETNASSKALQKYIIIISFLVEKNKKKIYHHKRTRAVCSRGVEALQHHLGFLT